MRFWRVDQRARPAPAGQLDLSRAAELVSSISEPDADRLAASILRIVGDAMPVSQCTVFAYEDGGRPRTVSAADHRGGRFLHDVADRYARHFYALDGNRAVIGPAEARGASASPTSRREPNALVLHQQRRDEIEHEAYRLACYAHPQVSDRISLLTQPSDPVWLAINLYRDDAYGAFAEGEVAHIERLAPTVAHAARAHFALAAPQPGAQPWIARLRRMCPALTPRELDVLSGVLDGETATQIAARMGVKASSVVTYQKRGYARLGVTSQRQLFALCMTPARPSR